MNVFIEAYRTKTPTSFEQKQVSQLTNIGFLYGKLHLDTQSPFFPQRSDLKIMRDDIVASVICVRELLNTLNLDPEDIINIPLFVANGAFVDKPEKYLRRIPELFVVKSIDHPRQQLLKEVYQRVPPLLALETLTNSAMSYIAQYCGLKSRNATFGNTSASGYFALKAGADSILHHSAKRALVCCSDCSDMFSFLANSSLVADSNGWKESAASGAVMLSSLKEKALAKIVAFYSDNRVPDLFSNEIHRNWKNLLPDSRADLIIFSGAYTDRQFADDGKYLSDIKVSCFSLFQEFGNCGPTNLALGISQAVAFLTDRKGTVDIIDRDVYGRETGLRVQSC